MSRQVGECKFTIYNVVPLFKFYETTFCTISFDWIEFYERATRVCKSETNSGIVRVDSKGVRLSDN
jgi:hypothetical protein